MFKRMFLFLATNMAVLALVSIVMSILGVNPQQFGGLLIMAALFGFGGSIISLLVSKWMAKRATGAHVIEAPRKEAAARPVPHLPQRAGRAAHRTPRSIARSCCCKPTPAAYATTSPRPAGRRWRMCGR